MAAKNLYNKFKIENFNPIYEEYKETYNHIKNLKFKITDSLKNAFGKREYSDFYQYVKCTLKLRINAGIGVDMVWEELCELYPQFFSPKIILPSEQLKKLPGHPFYNVTIEKTRLIQIMHWFESSCLYITDNVSHGILSVSLFLHKIL